MTQVNEQQKALWLDRYALKDANGQVVEKDVDETFTRIAHAIADDAAEEESFLNILQDFKFVPGGRIIAGAGAETEKTFYNCYVIPVETKARRVNRSRNEGYQSQRKDSGSDSREAIFDTMLTMVDIMSRGGGVGINWSVLRPSGWYLTRVSGTSSGPVGWMDVASTAVGEVIQGGSRRGAAMFMLDDWHPDIQKFIEAKRTQGKITNANISVSVSDAFMEAVKTDSDWQLRFPDTTHKAYDVEWDGDLADWIGKGYPVVEYAIVKARDIWDGIASSAHASGEPGVVFLDRYNQLSTANGQERIISVNPCGEQGLGAYSVCNLGSMNLDAYCRKVTSTYCAFDWGSFTKDVATAIRFLDNVIDKTFTFIPETGDRQKSLRRIGLGVMGLADALVRLGIRYGSSKAVEFTEKVFKTMKDAAIVQSIELASEKGQAGGWRDDMWQRPYLKEYRSRHLVLRGARPALRNIFLLTQAPTGTTSLFANVNSGIEPYFALKTWRQDRTGGRYVYARAVQEALRDEPVTGAVGTPEHIVTANEVTVDEHIAMQAAVQRWVDSSVSKTINAPNEQTVDETKKAFTLAYESGLKGIAYYRDGSRSKQVLYNEDPNVVIANLEAKVKELAAKVAWQNRGLQEDGTYIVHKTAALGFSTFVKTGVDRDDVCPSCRVGTIAIEEGCKMCHSCGWSAC